jgi:hypothetical protein
MYVQKAFARDGSDHMLPDLWWGHKKEEEKVTVNKNLKPPP